ncbi:ferrous iron transport protein A [candidate division KSB1 bacterium]
MTTKPEGNTSTIPDGNGGFYLDQAPKGSRVTVLEVEGGLGIRRNLSQMGINVGDRLTVQRRGIMSGPIMVSVNGIIMAIGRGIAGRVLVNDSPKS